MSSANPLTTAEQIKSYQRYIELFAGVVIGFITAVPWVFLRLSVLWLSTIWDLRRESTLLVY